MHFTKDCTFLSHTCSRCSKVGHKEGYCNVGANGKGQGAVPKASVVKLPGEPLNNADSQCSSNLHAGKHLHASKNSDDKNSSSSLQSADLLNVNKLKQFGSRKYVDVKINGIPISLQLDTAADVTIITESDWEVLGCPPLKSAACNPVDFNNNRLRIRGVLVVQIELKGIKRIGECYVTETDTNLFGGPWLTLFELWDQAPNAYCGKITQEPESVDVERVDGEMRYELSDVFSPTLGCFNLPNVQLHLKPDSAAVFRPKRQVPFRVNVRVEEKLERLQMMGIIMPVDHSEFAAPLVIVQKSNGGLRVCADYSTGLYYALLPHKILISIDDRNDHLDVFWDVFKRISDRVSGESHDQEIPVKFAELGIATDAEAELQQLKDFIKGWPSYTKAIKSGEVIKCCQRRNSFSVINGVIISRGRTIPPPLRLRFLHNAHLGKIRMQAQARGYVYWPRIDQISECCARFRASTTLMMVIGTQFVSSYFEEFCSLNNIKHLTSPAYHPQSNGQAESFVGHVKRNILKDDNSTPFFLHKFLQSYRATRGPHTPTGQSPAELMFGRKLRLPLDAVLPPKEHRGVRNSQMEEQFNRKHGTVEKFFEEGESVTVRQSPKNKWTKGTVIERIGSVMYNVAILGGQRPATESAAPPRRNPRAVTRYSPPVLRPRVPRT